MKPLFEKPEEKAQALIAAAAVAAHAIVSGTGLGGIAGIHVDGVLNPEARKAIVEAAFDLAADFLAEAERRAAAL